MRTNMTLIFALVAFIGCQTGGKTAEDKLYTCLVEHYDENGIDLDASLDSLEDHLVQVGVLTSKDGQGKITYYEQVIDQGEVPHTSETALMKSLRNAHVNMDQVMECIKDAPTFDSLEFYSSKFSLTSQKISNDVKAFGATNPVNVSKAIIANLKPADFELPLYRAHVLISIVMTNERAKAYTRTLPKQTQSQTSTGQGFLIDISVPDTFLMNNQIVEKVSIEPALVQYLASFDASTYVRFRVSGNTPYQQFAEVQEIIRNAYKTHWNQVAMKTFNRPFSQLTSGEQEGIELEYPIRITEEVKK